MGSFADKRKRRGEESATPASAEPSAPPATEQLEAVGQVAEMAGPATPEAVVMTEEDFARELAQAKASAEPPTPPPAPDPVPPPPASQSIKVRVLETKKVRVGSHRIRFVAGQVLDSNLYSNEQFREMLSLVKTEPA